MKRVFLLLVVCSTVVLTGCPNQPATPQPVTPPGGDGSIPPIATHAVQVMIDRLAEIGADYRLNPSGKLVSIRIPDASSLTPEDFPRLAALTELESLQIEHYRELNDTMAAELKPLVNLKKLGITDCIITNATPKMIVESFPKLVDLDLSSNTLLTDATLAELAEMTRLERLTLIQCGFSDIGAMDFEKLTNLVALDIRGAMEIGDMGLEVLSKLPKLRSLKHRSTAVMDYGIECLASSQSLETIEAQDFMITNAAGQHFNAMPKLTRLDIFRCQGFGSDGVLALAGKPLVRLKLRDLPPMGNPGMAVLKELPGLKQLILHEIPSVDDKGLADIETLQKLELLDVWIVGLGDATISKVAKLPNLKTLSLRQTEITDAAIDSILAMPKLEELTLRDNPGITPEGLKKLEQKQFRKLAVESAGSASSAPE